MTDRRAEQIIKQLNPIIKTTPGIVRRLAIDLDNEDILFINMFGVILSRVNYPEISARTFLQKLNDELI